MACVGVSSMNNVCAVQGVPCTSVCGVPRLMQQSPLFSLNLKVTLLEAPNVELTLN